MSPVPPAGGRTEGVVRSWSDVDGWGVLDSEATPGGCFAHFSMVVHPGSRSLVPGRPVVFTFDDRGQDGCGFRALLVWPEGTEPGSAPPPPTAPSQAYSSRLTITYGGPPGHLSTLGPAAP